MASGELHKNLQELHSQLQQLESLAEPDRKLLEQLRDDIQELLVESGSAEPTQYDKIGEQLTEAVEKLEASHPTLTMLMGQIIDALSKIGI